MSEKTPTSLILLINVFVTRVIAFPDHMIKVNP